MDDGALPIVITGHVDHGKSTLIGRLLYDTGRLKEDRYREIVQTSSMLGKRTEFAFALDALEEERQKGITIDTTQIFFQTRARTYVIIDAPGHKEFLKNMITGASHAEAAVLIVDAREGVREQTRRHAYLLGLVGIRQMIVLINKMDLVGNSSERFEALKAEIAAFLAGIGLKPRVTVPISAISGANVARMDPAIDWYHGPCLLEALDALDYTAFEQRPFRFPVQDVYEIDNQRIVAGRIESGETWPGMEAFLMPGGTRAVVRAIKKFNRPDPPRAFYGESIGLLLDDGGNARRGDVLSEGPEAAGTREFGAHVFWFEGTCDETDSLTFKCATQEAACRISIEEKFDPATMDRKSGGITRLELGEVAKVRILTDRPVVVDAFWYIPETGRFVIEKNGIPVGGGIVV